MSRNLPLQLEQMWTNPKAYAVYNSFARNADAGEEGDVVPQWVREMGGFKLPFGEDLYANPDLGFSRVGQDIEMLRDPLRFGANLNPLLKTGAEYWAGKQFFRDIPLSENKYVKLEGGRRVVQPLLELLGAVERGPNGQAMVSEKNNYVLQQLVPGLQEFERLVMPTQDNYKQRQGQSILTFLTGAPVTKVTEAARNSERERLKRELAARKAKKKAVAKGARE
jgi:hypothetical protein